MQRVTLNVQRFCGTRRRSDIVPATLAALDAVAGDDRAQWPVDPVPHRPAHAAAMGRGMPVSHGLFPNTKVRKDHTQQVVGAEGAGNFIECVLS